MRSLRTAALRKAAAATAAAGVLALTAACGNGGGEAQDKPAPSGSSSERSEKPESPHRNAYWRLQVVNALTALRTPEDGKYRAWISDDPDQWLDGIIYTPRGSSDPGWEDRDRDGTVRVLTAKLSPKDKTALFDALTLDGEVIPSTLRVVEPPPGEADDSEYKFTFEVKTENGEWHSGMAIGRSSGDPKSGEIRRLTYDIGQ